MKILWISKHNAPDTDMQCDLLFLGLRQLLGPDVVDVKQAYRAYKDYFGEGKMFPANELSFTLGGLLEDIAVDREDIVDKIKLRYFDFVFFGSIYRDKTFLTTVLSYYPTSRIVFIDGEDEGFFTPEVGRGFYFKRELLSEHPSVFPIQFAIPREKILDPAEVPLKIRLMAPSPATAMSPESTPGHDIRMYSKESDYYRQYGESFFGITKKKGGWNTLRHLEIMAAGSLPYFEGLENCPHSVMVDLPKEGLMRARRLYDSCEGDVARLDGDKYWSLLHHVRGILHNHLTTEALAKKVLDRITQ